MISIFKAYKNGLAAAWNEKKMLFWMYGFNLLFAYLVTMPLFMMLSQALDKTRAAEKVLQAFDLTIFLTIMDEFGKGVNLGRTLSSIGILYIIVNIFFSGGILKVFVEELNFNLKEFLAGCVEYFNRFLRLFLFSLIFILLAIVTHLMISKLFGFLTKNSATEHLPIILFVLKYLILAILLAMINMIFDYAKIMTVVNDFHGMYKTIKDAIMFVMMSPRKTLGLYFSYVLTVVFFLIIYLFLESYISVTGWITIFIFFIWTQLFMLARIFIRLSFFAGQYSLYHFSNTAMPGMTKKMLDEAVSRYESGQDKNQDEMGES